MCGRMTSLLTPELLAGIYEVTTSANELIAPIHERMPVILSQDSINIWLDLGAPKEEVTNLLKPSLLDLLEVYPVSNPVNNPKFDSPSCIARV